jgi:O-antigen/teichoic acid export membrane protein
VEAKLSDCVRDDCEACRKTAELGCQIQQLIKFLRSSAGRFLPKSDFASKVAMLASGAATAQLITLLSLPFLTRLFSPEEFGVLASYMAIIGVVSAVSGLRYEMAIPLATSDLQAFHLLLLSLGLVLVCAVVTTGLVMLIPAHVLPLGGVKWLIPVGIASVGVYQALSYWALRNKAYKDLGKTKFSQGISRAVTQIGAGLLGAGAPGLAVGEVLGRSAGLLRLGWGERHHIRECRSRTTRKGLMASARAYREFPIIVTPASLLNSAGLQVPTLLIASFYGPLVAGWYFVAQRIVALPVQMIARAVGDAFLAEAPEMARQDPAKLQRMFRRVSNNMLLAGVLPAVFLIVVSPWALPWAFGSDWKTSGVFLQLLTAPYLLALAYSPINFAIIGRNDYSLVWATLRLVATAGSVLASSLMGLSPIACIAMLSFALSVSYLVERWMWERGVAQLIERNFFQG